MINLSKFVPFFIPNVYRACSFFTNLDLFCIDNARYLSKNTVVSYYITSNLPIREPILHATPVNSWSKHYQKSQIYDNARSSNRDKICVLRRACNIAKSHYQLRHVCVCPTVSPSARNSATTERIFMKFHIWRFLENLYWKFTFHLKCDKKKRALHMNTYIHIYDISRWIILRMGKLSDKSCRENENIDFILNKHFSFGKSRRFWDNAQKSGRVRQVTDDNIIKSMGFACWITKATNTLRT